jgi:hypothetical protein
MCEAFGADSRTGDMIHARVVFDYQEWSAHREHGKGAKLLLERVPVIPPMFGSFQCL